MPKGNLPAEKSQSSLVLAEERPYAGRLVERHNNQQRLGLVVTLPLMFFMFALMHFTAIGAGTGLSIAMGVFGSILGYTYRHKIAQLVGLDRKPLPGAVPPSALAGLNRTEEVLELIAHGEIEVAQEYIERAFRGYVGMNQHIFSIAIVGDLLHLVLEARSPKETFRNVASPSPQNKQVIVDDLYPQLIEVYRRTRDYLLHEGNPYLELTLHSSHPEVHDYLRGLKLFLLAWISNHDATQVDSFVRAYAGADKALKKAIHENFPDHPHLTGDTDPFRKESRVELPARRTQFQDSLVKLRDKATALTRRSARRHRKAFIAHQVAMLGYMTMAFSDVWWSMVSPVIPMSIMIVSMGFLALSKKRKSSVPDAMFELALKSANLPPTLVKELQLTHSSRSSPEANLACLHAYERSRTHNPVDVLLELENNLANLKIHPWEHPPTASPVLFSFAAFLIQLPLQASRSDLAFTMVRYLEENFDEIRTKSNRFRKRSFVGSGSRAVAWSLAMYYAEQGEFEAAHKWFDEGGRMKAAQLSERDKKLLIHYRDLTYSTGTLHVPRRVLQGLV